MDPLGQNSLRLYVSSGLYFPGQTFDYVFDSRGSSGFCGLEVLL